MVDYRRLAAYGACAGALGSGVLRTYWSFSRGSGLPGDGLLGIAAGWGAATLCLVAAVAALATVAEWGHAVPRPALLTVSWATCALLLFTALRPIGEVGGLGGFGNRALCLAGGVLWLATAWAYQVRTRPERVSVQRTSV